MTARRAGSIVLRILSGAVAVLVAACSSDDGGRGAATGRRAPTGGVAGFEERLTDTELTQAVPVVVEGVVTAERRGFYADHPDLEVDLTAEERQLVDAGLRYVEWTIRVEKVAKGAAPPSLVARRAYGASGLVEGELPHPPVGERRVFWLEPGEAYTSTPYYVLVGSAP